MAQSLVGRDGAERFPRGRRGAAWWLQAVESSSSATFWFTGASAAAHNPFLWRFHAIHHTSQHLDWLAAHREHPLDSVYQLSLINLPPLLIGFPLQTIAGLIAFRGIWAIYIHSNVRIPLGPIKMLIGAPQLHHWHHDRSRNAGNYANISPLMDLMFGTYVCPDHEPEELGIREDIPKSYLGQMLYPLAPSWFKAREAHRVDAAGMLAISVPPQNENTRQELDSVTAA